MLHVESIGQGRVHALHVAMAGQWRRPSRASHRRTAESTALWEKNDWRPSKNSPSMFCGTNSAGICDDQVGRRLACRCRSRCSERVDMRKRHLVGLAVRSLGIALVPRVGERGETFGRRAHQPELSTGTQPAHVENLVDDEVEVGVEPAFVVGDAVHVLAERADGLLAGRAVVDGPTAEDGMDLRPQVLAAVLLVHLDDLWAQLVGQRTAVRLRFVVALKQSPQFDVRQLATSPARWRGGTTRRAAAFHLAKRSARTEPRWGQSQLVERRMEVADGLDQRLARPVARSEGDIEVAGSPSRQIPHQNGVARTRSAPDGGSHRGNGREEVDIPPTTGDVRGEVAP